MKKSHVAGWASDSPTPAQLKEFFSQIESGRITKRTLQVFLRDKMVFVIEAIAHQILGDDIILPVEIAEARGLFYSKDQLRNFVDTIPSKDTLRWCKANSYAVVAGPPRPLGLLDIRSLQPELFCSKVGGWYENYGFAREDKMGTEWLAIRKEPVPNSTNKTWEKQCQLLSEEEKVPNVSEMSWFLTTFFEVRGAWPSEGIRVRTSSVLSGDNLVNVSLLEGRLDVSKWWGHQCVPVLGLAAARKL